jgi:ACS family glucarate transporter-like MFS transporter
VGYRPTNVRYVVLFGLCLAAGLAYIHRGCLSVVESTVRGDLDVSLSAMGSITSAFFWAYALFQIPTGLLVDRWGPRRSLLLFGLLGAATMAMSAGRLWTDAAAGFTILFCARLLMGIAQAGLFPASTRAMSVWIPIERRAFAAGMLQACMSLGGAIGAYTTARLLGIVTWPYIFLIYAVPGLIWSAWFFAWYRDRPNEHASTNEAERRLLRPATVETGHAVSHWSGILVNRPIALLCLQQFFRAGGAAFWFSWCPTYLQYTQNLDKQAAGELTSIPIFGFMIGNIIGGLVADRLYRHTGSRRISRCGTAIGATMLGVVWFASVPLIGQVGVWPAVAALTLAAFFVSGGNSSSYSTAMDLGGRQLAAVFGAMNMCGNFGAALLTKMVPEWVAGFDWNSVAWLVGGTYFFGLISWLPLNPDAKAPTIGASDCEGISNS